MSEAWSSVPVTVRRKAGGRPSPRSVASAFSVRPRRLLSLCCALAAVGCLTAGCMGADDRPPAWEYLSPAIFQPNCATSSCHSRAAAVAGLDFSDPDRGYTSLTGLWVWIEDPQGTLDEGCKPLNGSVFCQRPHRPMVTPFDPAQSRLVNMLRARAAPRMPKDRPLPEADIQLVERWILNGATRTAGGHDPVDGGVVDRGGDGDGDGAGGGDASGESRGAGRAEGGAVQGGIDSGADSVSDASTPDQGARS